MQRLMANLILALCMLFAVPITAASAQATRTWISGVGDDVNPCSRTAPCKTFAGAISKTAASGEINCLDPGGFGAVTIVKAITLDCSDVSNGGILAAGTNGVIINAGATDRIVLKGLAIEGISPSGSAGLNGIRFLAGGSLTVDQVQIRDFSQNGISFTPSGAANLYVSDVLITNAGTSGTFAGVQIRPTGTGNVLFSISQSNITNGRFGIVADGTGTTGKISGLVRDSVVSGHLQNGITSSVGTATNATIMVDNVSITGNGNNGLATSGVNAGMLVNNSAIFANGGGVFATSGGVIVSYGTNLLNGNNGNDGAFTSIIAKK